MLKKIKELDKNSFMWKLLLIGKMNQQVLQVYLEKLTVTEIQKLIKREWLKMEITKITLQLIIPIKLVFMLSSIVLYTITVFRVFLKLEELLLLIQNETLLLIFILIFLLIILLLINVFLNLLCNLLIQQVQNKKDKIEFIENYLKNKLK